MKSESFGSRYEARLGTRQNHCTESTWVKLCRYTPMPSAIIVALWPSGSHLAFSEQRDRTSHPGRCQRRGQPTRRRPPCRSKSVGPWPGAARTGAARRRRGRQECRRPRAEKIRTRRSAPGGRAGPSASSLTGPLICQPGGRGALVRGNGLQPLILRKFARTAH